MWLKYMAFATIYQLSRATDVAVKEFVKQAGTGDSWYNLGYLDNLTAWEELEYLDFMLQSTHVGTSQGSAGS